MFDRFLSAKHLRRKTGKQSATGSKFDKGKYQSRGFVELSRINIYYEYYKHNGFVFAEKDIFFLSLGEFDEFY